MAKSPPRDRLMAPLNVYKIVPGEGAHWVILDEDGSPVLSGQDFRTQREALAALQDEARAKGMSLKIHQKKGTLESVEAYPKRSLTLRLSVPPELDDIIDSMSEDLGLSK